jgi:hypothetical protein
MRQALLLLLFLAACHVAKPLTENNCGAGALQTLVNQNASVLRTMRFGQEVRILRPGDAVTKDYRPDRLNICIDASETISRVMCS